MFATIKKLNRRQVRWADKLSTFDFQVKSWKGTQNEIADMLSKRSKYRPGEGYGDSENLPVRTFFKPKQWICVPDQDMLQGEEQENPLIAMVWSNKTKMLTCELEIAGKRPVISLVSLQAMSVQFDRNL